MTAMRDVIHCRICDSYIDFDTNGKYTPCACGAIAVDGGKEYVRITGTDWEIVVIPVCKE